MSKEKKEDYYWDKYFFRAVVSMGLVILYTDRFLLSKGNLMLILPFLVVCYLAIESTLKLVGLIK
jgi:hypothetical protein